jgi:hypothetical protein
MACKEIHRTLFMELGSQRTEPIHSYSFDSLVWGLSPLGVIDSGAHSLGPASLFALARVSALRSTLPTRLDHSQASYVLAV